VHAADQRLTRYGREFGVCIARGLARVIGFAEDILAGEVLDLPEIANEVIYNMCEHLMALHARIRWYEDRLKQVAKDDARVRLLRTIPGVGAVTASAIIASIGDGHQFRNGREFAAWLGLTPANKSSGGKEKLGRITKMGDQYLRSLLVVGMTSLVRQTKSHPECEGLTSCEHNGIAQRYETERASLTGTPFRVVHILRQSQRIPNDINQNAAKLTFFDACCVVLVFHA